MKKTWENALKIVFLLTLAALHTPSTHAGTCAIGGYSPTEVTQPICVNNFTIHVEAPVVCDMVTNDWASTIIYVNHTPGEYTPDEEKFILTADCGHKECDTPMTNKGSVAIIYLTDCDSDSDCTAGGDAKDVSSFRHRFKLGNTGSGDTAGLLEIYTSDIPAPPLATPAALRLLAPRGLDIVRNPANGALSQIMAPECFVSIQTRDQHGYTISFYTPDKVNATLDPEGNYTLRPGSAPFAHYLIENPDTGFQRLRVSKTFKGVSSASEYSWVPTPGGGVNWSLDTGNGLRRLSLSVEPDGAAGTIKTRTTQTQDGAIALIQRKHYAMINDRQVITASITDPDGVAETTRYFYITDANDPHFGKLELKINPDGSWTKNEFDGRGLIAARHTGWLNAPTNAPADQIVTTSYDYTPFLRDAEDYLWPDTRTTDPATPRVETVSIGDTILSKTLRVIYTDTMLYKIVEEAHLPDPSCTNYATAWADPATPRTRTQYMPKNDALPWSERPELIRYPDGRQETYTYTRGDYTPGSYNTPGTFSENPFGKHLRTTLTHGTTNHPAGLAHRTTREITIGDHAGRTLQTVTQVYDGAAYQTIAWRAHTLNELGQTVATTSSDGTTASAGWGCCGTETETTADGIITEYAYDALQRPILTTRLGHDNQPDLYTETAYDAAGRTTFRQTFAAGLAQTTTNTYDLAGRLTWTRHPDGTETTYNYTPSSTTTIRSGISNVECSLLDVAVTNVTVRFTDGHPHYTEQNGLRQQTHSYGVNPDGTRWTTTFTGPAATNSPVWQTTITDPLSRTIAQIRPGFDNAILTTSNHYNTAGHLIRTEQWVADVECRVSDIESRMSNVECRLLDVGRNVECRLLDIHLYTYDPLGNLLLTCQDLNLNGQIDLSGPDRVTGSDSRYALINSDWWHQTTSLSYGGSPVSPLTNSISRTRLTSLGGSNFQHPTFAIQGATLTAETHSIDHLGNTTTSRTFIDRDYKTIFHITIHPASAHDSCSQTVNGLLEEATGSSGHTTFYSYDGLGRQIATEDARGAIHSRAYDQYGRVTRETDPENNTTAYAYDPLGRVIATTNALGEATFTTYDVNGRVIATWGATYPVEYDYDDFGRMITMRTFRDEDGPGDETRWYYHEPTGLLTNKLYADDKGTTYSYTPDGKLASRTWARGITTTYSYDTAHNLTSISYWRSSVSAIPDPDTPNITFTHDRLGRITSAIVDGVSTNLYSYDALTQALASETQNGVIITRATDVLGRNIGFALDNDYVVEYGYDTYGRFASVASSVSSVNSVANYSYLANSDLLAGYALADFTRAVAYEPYRPLITSVENKHNSTTISRYDYENDALGRRTAIARSGVAFGDTPVRDSYGYNHRSEVTSARRTLAGNPSQEIRGFSYDYAYDPIGNRVSSTEYDPDNTPLISSYTANALNQYEQRTVPGYAAVRGSATNSATVTVNGNPVWRLDDYFYGGDEADNSTTAIMKELAIVAAHSNHYAAATGHVFVAHTPEQYQYDDDGNLTQDGRFTYTWDAENRLIGITTRNDLPPSVPRVHITHRYDHQSRRIATEHTVWNGIGWDSDESRNFTYDGWNVIHEVLSPESCVLSTNLYAWGLDLSGSLQGAGGIGGLLSASFGGPAALYTYDANGNVSQLIDPTTHAILTHYEYDPFGKTIVSSGPLAKTNPFRFSTKWFDNATLLGDWGYRWYNPGMGRWLNRDPIGERGGTAIYGFARNGSVNLHDISGHTVVAPIPEIQLPKPKIPDTQILPKNWSDGFTCKTKSAGQWFCKNCAWLRPGGKTALITGYCSTCLNACTAWCIMEAMEQDAIDAGFDVKECTTGCKARQSLCIGSGCNLKF